jgi:type I restriction enzyme, S subunit
MPTQNDWQVYKVEELIARDHLEVGDGYRAKNSEMGSTGLPFLRVANIQNGSFDFTDIDILDTKNLHKVGNKISQTDDIVFTTKGTVGRFAFVKENTPKFVYSPQISYWRVKDKETLDPKYLLYWLKGPEFTKQVYQVKGLTDMADYVNLSDQRRMKIIAPSLPIQHKIADVLSAYDDLIEVNTRRIRILEQMAQSVYREWFGGVDEKSLPEGWKIKEIGDIAKVKGGKRLPKGHNVIDQITAHPYLRVRDFTDRGLSRDDIKYIDEETFQAVSNYTITSDDIYISIAGTIGRVGIVSVDYSNANLTENAAKICNLSPLVNKHFLLHFLQSSEGQKQIASRVVGTSQPKLALFRIKEIQFPLPPQHIMDKVGKILSEFAQLIEVLDKKNANLRRTRDLLLPRLVSGEVSVDGL